MKTSVVIPVYNEENHLSNCLKHLQNQEEKPDEIIVVDNNSTDKTVQIASQYKVKIVKEKKQGIAHARNKGFDLAQHEIIVRCDADTLAPGNWIKRIKDNFNQEEIDALVGPLILYDLPFKTAFYSQAFIYSMKFLQKGKHTLLGPNMAITKKIWQKVKDEVCQDDSRVHEDIDLAIHINKAGGKIKYDSSLVAKASGRRIKNNPLSFFIEYPFRLVKTFIVHW